jgi:murein DD-endopeptidase MepM/ murein hydrolase activator NlpD
VGLGQKSSWLTTRLFFQLLGLGIFLIAAYPHTKLYNKFELGYDWQHIKLYTLTRQDAEIDQPLDTIEIVEGSQVNPEVTPSWRQEVFEAGTGEDVSPAHSDTIAVAVEGRALVKPLLIPDARARTRIAEEEYTIRVGDSIAQIAAEFGVTVETILVENNLTSRSAIRPGQVLKIPPVSGVMHVVAKGDTVKKIADLYKAPVSEIIAFNKLNSDGSGLVVGTRIMVPQGKKPTPITPPATNVATTGRTTPRTGSRSVAGVALPVGTPGAPFESGFIWPTNAVRINRGVGFGHTGLDIGTYDGTAFGRPTFAAKSGTVKFAGWNNGGYGNLIVIDHGGGFETYYGHHSQIYVNVGEHVEQGQTIGAIGSTGRSTGPHLHFEIRFNGKITNPLDYVRAPAR